METIEINSNRRITGEAIRVSPDGMRYRNKVAWPYDIYIENVTPVRAAELLKLNNRNRPISKRIVDQYAWDQENGKWHLIPGSPVIIGEDNVLYNAQHRLMAIIKSGVTIPMEVVYNFPKSLRHLIDGGRSKTNSDQLYIVRGIKGARMVAATIGAWHNLKFGEPPKGSISYLEEFLEYDSIKFATTLEAPSKVTSTGWFRGAMAALYDAPSGACVIDFAQECSDFSRDPYKYPQPNGGPIMSLFRWLERRKAMQGGPAAIKRQCATIVAFDAWQGGSGKIQIRVKPGTITRLASKYNLSERCMMVGVRTPDISQTMANRASYED